jgi:hypothetical protein
MSLQIRALRIDRWNALAAELKSAREIDGMEHAA